MALVIGYLGRYQESLERLQELLEQNPDFATARFWKSYLHVFLGEFGSAIEEAKKAIALEGSPFMRLNLAWVSAEAGKRAEANEILDAVLRGKFEEYFRPAQVGLVELALGNDDEAFRWLEMALAERDTRLLDLGSLPWFKKYRADPRWLRLDQEMGFEPTP
jgi:tetratricopeptide (TPR) repeat protein